MQRMAIVAGSMQGGERSKLRGRPPELQVELLLLSPTATTWEPTIELIYASAYLSASTTHGLGPTPGTPVSFIYPYACPQESLPQSNCLPSSSKLTPPRWQSVPSQASLDLPQPARPLAHSAFLTTAASSADGE